jgi:hypothetical protein
MIRSFDDYNSVWLKKPVFKLDPEFIEKEIKGMNAKTLKLTNRFSAMSSAKRDEKNKKAQILQGPLKMLDWLSNQVKDYIKYIPLIRVFSNPGMKERHWKGVS